jgi:hypothetical protein
LFAPSNNSLNLKIQCSHRTDPKKIILFDIGLALPLTAKMNVIEMDFDDEEILETEIDNLVRLLSSAPPSNPSAMAFLDKISRLKE